MKKGLWIAAVVLAFAALAYTAAWFHGANRFDQAIADWKDEAEANGATITHDEVRISGYPFALVAVLREVTLRAEGARVSLEAAPIRLRATLWNPNRLDYDIAGKHALTVTGDRQTTRTIIEVGTGAGEVVLDGDRREDRATITDVRFVNDNGIVSVARIEISGFADPNPADGGADTFHMVYALDGLDVSSRLGVKLFEPAIERVRLDLAATGPFVEIFRGGTVVDWANAGGVLALRDFTLEWSGLALTASGSGSFDAELRPSGSLTLVSVAFEEGLKSLENSGTIPPHLGEWIRRLVQPFLVPPAGDNKSQLVVPITAADGILSVGGQPMASIPSLKEL